MSGRLFQSDIHFKAHRKSVSSKKAQPTVPHIIESSRRAFLYCFTNKRSDTRRRFPTNLSIQVIDVRLHSSPVLGTLSSPSERPWPKLRFIHRRPTSELTPACVITSSNTR